MAAVLFHFVADLCWLKEYDVPPSWDWAIHLTKSLEYSDLAREGRWLELRDVDDFYPPLSRLPAALAYPLFGRGDTVAVLANFAWFALLLTAVYALASRFGNGTLAGTTAVIFASFIPFLYDYTRFYALVIPTTAAAAAALWALARTDNFQRPSSSLAFGAVLGLALLVKWTVAVFVLPAAIWAALCPASSLSTRGRRVIHFAAAGALAGALASPWYLRHLFRLIRATQHTAVEAVAQGDPAVFTAASFTHYLSAAVYQMGIFMFVAGLLAVAYCAVRRRRGWVTLLLWIIGSYVVLTLVRNKDYRFTAPMLPAFAVAFGVACADIRRRPLRYAFGGLAAAYVLAIFAVTSFGVGGLPPRCVWELFGTRLVVYDSERPRREYWHITYFLDEVAVWEARAGRRPNLCVIPNVATFAEATFCYYATRDRVNVNIFRPREDFPNFCDLIIAKAGDQGDDKGRRAFDKLRNEPRWLRNGYAVARRCRLPDGSSAVLYRREVRPGGRAVFTPAEAADTARRAYPALLGGAENLAVDLDPAAAGEGRFRNVYVTAAETTLAGMPVSNLRIALRNVIVNPWAAPDVHLMRTGSVFFRLRVARADAARKFEEACPGFINTTVSANENRLSVQSKYGSVPISATTGLYDDGRQIKALCYEASICGIPLPTVLLRYVNTQAAPIADRERLPFEIGTVGLRRVPDGIEIAAGDM